MPAGILWLNVIHYLSIHCSPISISIQVSKNRSYCSLFLFWY